VNDPAQAERVAVDGSVADGEDSVAKKEHRVTFCSPVFKDCESLIQCSKSIYAARQTATTRDGVRGRKRALVPRAADHLMVILFSRHNH
jgi:hypothetical protein